MSKFWQIFWDNYLWNNYHSREPKTAVDLYYQAAKTANKKPITEEAFSLMLQRIKKRLELTPEDHLLDLCCGNGLVSFELAPTVKWLTGIDFAEQMIRAARHFKSRQNTSYYIGDVTTPISTFVGGDVFPNKILMSGSLAYFEPHDLHVILTNIREHLAYRPFCAFFTDIPNDDLKWNFYNTPERRARYLENEKQVANVNDGVGRWWRAEEIEAICLKYRLNVGIGNQPAELSNYRMDALITSAR